RLAEVVAGDELVHAPAVARPAPELAREHAPQREDDALDPVAVAAREAVSARDREQERVGELLARRLLGAAALAQRLLEAREEERGEQHGQLDRGRERD